MNRRKFVMASGLLASASVLPRTSQAHFINEEKDRIKPLALEKGDTIGLITPGSSLSEEAAARMTSNMEMLGFNVKFSSNFNEQKGFIAGTDQQRLDDLHEMFENPEVKGIICARGGYGTGRLLQRVNYDLIRSYPKVFVGYSDITALHCAIFKNTGLITFHGPVGSSEFSEYTTKNFERVLLKGKVSVLVKRPREWQDKNTPDYEFYTLSPGVAEGDLIGGNLSLICSLLGTPYDLGLEGKLVFLEEVGEKPYRIDRMLTHLLNAGKLDRCAGVILGVFYDCDALPDDKTSLMLREVLTDRLGALGVPVAYGLPFGHLDDNATLPIGIKARFNADEGELEFLEAGVT